MQTQFKKGDKVRFTTKFGDMVDGVFDHTEEIEIVQENEETLERKLVKKLVGVVTGKAFPPDDMEVHCIVELETLIKLEK